MFLMGASLLYGGSGTLDLGLRCARSQVRPTRGHRGVILVLLAFFLKAAIVPFHAWAPDAYEAASVPVTAYMATIIKAGVLLAVLRLSARRRFRPRWSTCWRCCRSCRSSGAISRRCASRASADDRVFVDRARRLPLLRVPRRRAARFQAVVFYLLAYGADEHTRVRVAAAWRRRRARDRLDDLKGLFQRQPYAAVMIAIAMLSLAGIPPFPGFIAKFLIFKNVIAAGYTLYAVLGLVGSYLGIYFYLRVIQLMFMSERPDVPSDGRIAIGAGVLCLVPTILLTVFPGFFIGLVGS